MGRCVGVKRVTPKLSMDFTCVKCCDVGTLVQQGGRMCDEMDTLRESTRCGDGFGGGGGVKLQ